LPKGAALANERAGAVETGHKQILKSTGVIGGAQVFTILIGIIRTKLLAIFLGPAGIGVTGLYQSSLDLVRSVTGCGISVSGVKDIAEAGRSDDDPEKGRAVLILRRWATATGILGMVAVVALCLPLSKYSFGNFGYAPGIAILSLVVFMTALSQGQTALLQGMRRMKSMAMATMAGALAGLVVTVPLYIWLGERGIIPGMLLTSLLALLSSWFFVRKIQVQCTPLGLKETFLGGLAMVKLGIIIVIVQFMFSVTMYLVKSFITRRADVATVGVFQSAWTISNSYLGIILNSMLADFYPRLSSLNKDDVKANRLMNEQSEIALLVGVPCLTLILLFVPLVVRILYTKAFTGGVGLIQWQMVSSFFTIISWPLGVLFLAKSRGVFGILNDFVWEAVFLAAIYLGWNHCGLEIVGIASLLASICKLATSYASVRYLSGFRWSKNVLFLVSVYMAILAASFGALKLLTGLASIAVCAMLAVASFGFSWFQLRKLVDLRQAIASIICRVVGKFGRG
jgi:O-antigen/teichoic acid export membrane protein